MKIIVLIPFILLSFLLHSQSQEVLTNQNVVGMLRQGLPISLIIKKIKTSKNNFDVTIDTLIKLKSEKVPEDVMNAMVDATGDNSTQQSNTDANDPKQKHDSGVYYLKTSIEKNEMIELEPSVYSQSTSGGFIASALTYGLANRTEKATLDGKEARMHILTLNPVFYFYFDISKNSLSQGNSNWWFSSATSPNEFLLVHLQKNSKARIVEVGSANIAGSSSGVGDKYKTPFKFEKVAQGIYQVYFEKPLPIGEYCFMYAGSIPDGYSRNKVYDFSIQAYPEK